MNKLLLSLLSIFLLFISVNGQEVIRDHDITFEDYFTQSFIQSISLSPDMKNVAYIEWRWDKDRDRRNRDLWTVNLASKEIKRLTSDPANEVMPQWAPDGKSIYFIGHNKLEAEKNPPYNGKSQVWRVDIDGKNLTPITRIENGVSDFQVSSDGLYLYYSVNKDHIDQEWKCLKSEYKGKIEFGHGVHKVTELWKLDLQTWHATKLTDHKRYINSFKASSDNKYIAMITDLDQLLINHEGKSIVEIFNMEKSTFYTLPERLWRDEAPSPYGWLGNLAWSDNSDYLAFTIDFDGYPARIYASDLNYNIKEMPRQQGVSVSGGLRWLPGKTELAFLGDYHALQHVYAIDYKSGESRQLTDGDIVIRDYDFLDKKGKMVTLQNGLTYHRDIFFHKSKNKSERLTRTNPQVDTWKLPQISRFTWKGANGDEVEGILELPPDYDGKGKLPLIVNLHGGPTDSEKYCMMFWIYGRTALAAKGYAVLAPNYRGSTGYGDKFLTDLIGSENNIDVEDILTGVDALIDKGIVDPERLGVMGWSNGGFLTNCLIATNRFKAASSGAGTTDMTIQWAEEDTPGHVVNYMEGLPWEQPEEYQTASPLYSLKPGITTATLIHVGKNDPRVPVSHSRALHRALHYYLDAPVELLVYPGAGHSLTTYEQRYAKLKWDHAWFDKYLPLD